MSENIDNITVNVAQKFLNATGLSHFWQKIVDHVSAVANEINASINRISTSLENYRGYSVEQKIISNGETLYINPNTYYKITLPTSAFETAHIALSNESNNITITNEYVFEFEATDASLAIDGTIIWENEDNPEFENGSTYIISIINNKAVYGKYDQLQH